MIGGALIIWSISDMACDEIDIEIGKRLKQARVAAGLTQTELGTPLGISFQQVQKYEKGRNRVGCGRLYKIARILGVKIAYFFDDVERLLDPDVVPAGANEVGVFDNRTIRAAHALANLSDEDIKEQVFRLIAALPKQKASR
jgi:transcriptional regulator with XRE-family HTH domain